MKIKLTQSGGIAGKKMEAIVDTKLSESEWNLLIKAVAKTPEVNTKTKDGINYSLQNNQDDNASIPIDIAAIPTVHNDLFTKIFNKLKPAK